MNSIKQLLTRPIAFHRVFVTLTGSVNAAIMLSQAYYWSDKGQDPAGWFYKTMKDWEEETGLSRTEQDNARKKLLTTNFWHEDRRGVPAKLFFRVDTEALFDSILQIAGNPQPEAFRLQETYKQDSGKPAIIIINKTTTENTKERFLKVIELLNTIKATFGIRGKITATEDRLLMIKARLTENKYDQADLEKMFRHRCEQWKGKEFERYLRIETLFRRSKFVGYMEESAAQPEKDWVERGTGPNVGPTEQLNGFTF